MKMTKLVQVLGKFDRNKVSICSLHDFAALCFFAKFISKTKTFSFKLQFSLSCAQLEVSVWLMFQGSC